MSKEAMKLALEALVIEDLACRYMKETTPDYIDKAITALQKALANEALDKMAENARELGLDYEPALQKPVGCEGAVVNGRVYADRLEHDYKFECEAGPLHLCTDWVEFRRCFEWLAQHTSPPAQAATEQSSAVQPAQQEQEPEEHRLLRRKWFGHRDTGHLSFTEAVDVTMEKIYAHPKQEPVAWIDEYGNAFPLAAKQYSVVGKHWKPLYTSPPAQRTWVGLANKEAFQICVDCGCLSEDWLSLLDAIEAKLRSKNT